jgi:hypothetical protein
MAGVKRRSKYRKNVTDSFLYGDPEPEEGQKIVRVLAPRGGNIVEVRGADGRETACGGGRAQEKGRRDGARVVSGHTHCHGFASAQIVEPSGAQGLCIIPTKFRKLLWVKRGACCRGRRANAGRESVRWCGAAQATT